MGGQAAEAVASHLAFAGVRPEGQVNAQITKLPYRQSCVDAAVLAPTAPPWPRTRQLVVAI
jgi:hypothetical protein